MSAVADRPFQSLEVKPGLFFDEIDTLEKCDAILDEVMVAIPSIESQIEMARIEPSRFSDPKWLINANHALRVKRLCLPRLQQLRSKLIKDEKLRAHAALQLSADRAILQVVKEIAPEIATKAWALARVRHPELFATNDGGSA